MAASFKFIRSSSSSSASTLLIPIMFVLIVAFSSLHKVQGKPIPSDNDNGDNVGLGYEEDQPGGSIQIAEQEQVRDERAAGESDEGKEDTKRSVGGSVDQMGESELVEAQEPGGVGISSELEQVADSAKQVGKREPEPRVRHPYKPPVTKREEEEPTTQPYDPDFIPESEAWGALDREKRHDCPCKKNKSGAAGDGSHFHLHEDGGQDQGTQAQSDRACDNNSKSDDSREHRHTESEPIILGRVISASPIEDDDSRLSVEGEAADTDRESQDEQITEGEDGDADGEGYRLTEEPSEEVELTLVQSEDELELSADKEDEEYRDPNPLLEQEQELEGGEGIGQEQEISNLDDNNQLQVFEGGDEDKAKTDNLQAVQHQNSGAENSNDLESEGEALMELEDNAAEEVEVENDQRVEGLANDSETEEPTIDPAGGAAQVVEARDEEIESEGNGTNQLGVGHSISRKKRYVHVHDDDIGAAAEISHIAQNDLPTIDGDDGDDDGDAGIRGNLIELRESS